MFGSFLEWETLSLGFAGLVIVALGAWVYLLRPKDARHRAFSLYLFLYGLADIAFALPFQSPRDLNAMDMAWSFAMLGAAWALVWFVLVYPRPRLSPSLQRRVLAVLGVGFAALGALMLILHDTGYRVQADGVLAYTPFYPLTSAAWLMPLALAPFVFSRDLLRSEDAKERSALRLVAVAGAIWPLYDLTLNVIALATSEGMARQGAEWLLWNRVARLSIELLVVAAVANLLRQAHREGRSMVPLVAALAIGPAAQLLRRGLGLEHAIGAVDLILPLVVTVAILRGGLFGLDVKLRFAISRSTLAAAFIAVFFIAVFFIASEAAQQFFGEQFQSGYLGILAAGGLVFAIAPLSRLTDRLAEKAVPLSGTAPVSAFDDREEMYRGAVRLALRDRRLTRTEERDLFRLARGLALDAERAHEILVEEERRGGGEGAGAVQRGSVGASVRRG